MIIFKKSAMHSSRNLHDIQNQLISCLMHEENYVKLVFNRRKVISSSGILEICTLTDVKYMYIFNFIWSRKLNYDIRIFRNSLCWRVHRLIFLKACLAYGMPLYVLSDASHKPILKLIWYLCIEMYKICKLFVLFKLCVIIDFNLQDILISR